MAALLRPQNQVCWRIHAPKWAVAPLSGEGAARTGGRLNRPGVAALYLAFDHGTAVQEYEQDLGWRPGTLCAYRVSGKFADLRKNEVLVELGFGIEDLRCPWKQFAYSDPAKEVPSWRIAELLVERRVCGAVYVSQANPAGTDLVLWRWNVRGGADVAVIDPLMDLPRNRLSWRGCLGPAKAAERGSVALSALSMIEVFP